MARSLGPVLPATAVGLLPFAVFATFLVPIAEGTGVDVAAVGALRGLGGLAAVMVGGVLAPLLDRLPRHHVTAAGLTLLAVATVAAAVGRFSTVVVFCVLMGVAMSVLNPALAAGAADRFDDDARAVRAATLVTATQSLTAMLGAPLVVLPSLLWGWRGSLVAVAVVAVALALAFGQRRGSTARASGERIGYLQTWRTLCGVPGAAVLLMVTLLRTAAFMGYLAYLAAFYAQRFALSPGQFAFVWTLSGASFFLGNLVGGRVAVAGGRRTEPERLLVLSLMVGVPALAGIYMTSALGWALAATAVLGASHAVAAACLTTLLVARAGRVRGSALGVSAATGSLGVFVGSAVGGGGLAVAGWSGVAVALGLLAVGSVLLALRLGSV